MPRINVKTDNYGYLTFDIPTSDDGEPYRTEFSLSFVYPHDNIPLSCDTCNEKTGLPVNLMWDFYESNCKIGCDGTRRLNLNGNKIISEKGRRLVNSDVPMLTIFLAKNQDIVALDLIYNDIYSAGFINIFDYTIKRDHILELDLQYNRLGHIAVKYILNHQEGEMKVKILRLRGNKIGAKFSRKLSIPLLNLTSLELLDVAEMDQNETSLTYYITKLRLGVEDCNVTLKSLDLSRPNPDCLFSKFNSQHCAEIAGLMLKNNVTLDELYMRKYNFYCHDIEFMMENARFNKTLKLLDLGCNNIGDHGMIFLAEWLEKRPCLQYLILDHNIITSHGIRTLARAITSSNLFMLDVSHNRIDDEGGVELLHSLQKYPYIRHLRLFGNDLKHETGKMLKSLIDRGIIDERYIDVKVYEVDGILQFAYFDPESWHSECK